MWVCVLLLSFFIRTGKFSHKDSIHLMIYPLPALSSRLQKWKSPLLNAGLFLVLYWFARCGSTSPIFDNFILWPRETTTHPAARFCLGWLVPLHRFPFASLWERDWRNMARDIHLMVVTAGPTPFPETNSLPRTPKIQRQQGTSKLI